MRVRRVIFERNDSYLGGILSDRASSDPYSSISILGKPLPLFNLEKLAKTNRGLKQLLLPTGMPEIANEISSSFPEIQVDEYDEDDPPVGGENTLNVSLNSIVVVSIDGNLALNRLVYPWDLLKAIDLILKSEIKTQEISEDASIESNSVIDGPCIIESGVEIDSFCKIKGPAYIGQGCRIGTGSLVRGSMLDRDCTIGFTCEVARSYVSANDTFPHYDAVLDSIVGEHTWMGGYVAITNVMLQNKDVSYKIGGELVDTGLSHFGAVIGHHSTIGAAVVIMPGRYVPPNSFIRPHVLYSSNEEQSPTELKTG